MNPVENLRVEHVEIRALALRLEVEVMQDRPASVREHLELRRSLATILTDHLEAEDLIVYPELLRHAESRISQAARRLQNEMGQLARNFSRYFRRWTEAKISSDWSTYRKETLVLLDALNKWIESEDDELYGLFDSEQMRVRA